jgi:presenilin-like A22 family membrane protease
MLAYILEAWEIGERKVLQCLGLFSFLAITYAIFLGMHLGVFHVESDQLARLCFISALPFTLLAFADRDWCSSDAAPVCVGAWVAVCVAFSFKCPTCVIGLAVAFFPFILSALLAHGLGTACRLFKERISR